MEFHVFYLFVFLAFLIANIQSAKLNSFTENAERVLIASGHARTYMNVLYGVCLARPPYYVKATVTPTKNSPITFNVKAVRINQYDVLLQIDRTDATEGWEEMSVQVNWTAYTSLPESCNDLREIESDREDGIYKIFDSGGSEYSVYCDMSTDGGGWTFVASIHENDMKGRCTAGDKWSSERGNQKSNPHGDGNWENNNTFGRIEYATREDYKNRAFFQLNASNLMVWYVPNNMNFSDYKPSAYIRYRTANNTLAKLGGNLQEIFRSYPIKYLPKANYKNGPSAPVVFDHGNLTDLMKNSVPRFFNEVEFGYVQFRALNEEKSAFAFCPGVRIVASNLNVEHFCVGSTSYHVGHKGIVGYCGDFSAFDWSTAKASDKLIHTTFFLFYR
ncbi:intelectin-1a-like [Ciona intestinalis]